MGPGHKDTNRANGTTAFLNGHHVHPKRRPGPVALLVNPRPVIVSSKLSCAALLFFPASSCFKPGEYDAEIDGVAGRRNSVYGACTMNGEAK